MKVLEPIITNKPSNIYIEDVFIQNNSISGDKIDGGTITNFRSDGIKDTAKNKQIIIHDGKVEIKGTIEYTSLKVSYGARVQGRIQHKGVVHSFNNVEEQVRNNNLEEDVPNESNEDNI